MQWINYRTGLVAAVLAAGMFVTGCGAAGTPAPGESPYPVATDTTGYPGYPGYPAPAEDPGPGYPVEDAFEQSFYANLTPVAPPPEVTADLGAVTATLLYMNTDDQPVRGQSIFAASVLVVEDVEDAFIPALDTNVDRNGLTDSMGNVVISLIPPGRYVLTLLTPLGAILVEEEGSTQAVSFEITAGEVTELGTLVVQLDPGPLEP